MAASSSSSPTDSLLPFSLAHLIPIKLNASNYLLWKNQVSPLLEYQNLSSHIDGSSTAPPKTVASGDKQIDNPLLPAWLSADQRAKILLNATLSEEAVSVIIGLTTARDIWVALQEAYGNASIERVHLLRDQLRLPQKGSKSVSDYGRSFKQLCDHLSAIGHPMDPQEQLHCFVCGLGPSFEAFSASIRTVTPVPTFSQLLAKAESYEGFSKSLHGSHSPSSPVAFMA